MQKIAIVGTGISGLTAAHLLHRAYEIDLFEANDYVGGHTNTIVVQDQGRSLGVDTGFIVYNETTYPNLVRLFNELEVPTQESDMSFSLSCRETGLEYAKDLWSSLRAHPRNLVSPMFWRMIADHVRFGRHVEADLDNPAYAEATIGAYSREKGYSSGFVRYMLTPMASAIWSAPRQMIHEFPAQYFFRFYVNHGLLQHNEKIYWRTVTNGSHSYVKKLIAPFRERVHVSCAVRAVERHADYVTLTLQDGSQREYDHVVLATHSDQALELLADPSPAERNILGRIPYQPNDAILHTDDRVMPRARVAWASWNYTLYKGESTENPITMTYWMNMLQNLDSSTNYYVTVNPGEAIDPARIIKRIKYSHPVYTLESLEARQQLPDINGQRRTHFCGAYCGFGFHEDGMKAGIAVAAQLGVPWE